MNRNLLKIMLACCVLAAANTVYAFDTTAGQSGSGSDEDNNSAYEVGSQTRQWLNMQREGAQASQQAQTLPGPVMDQVYQRYIKSFGHPIPDLYEERAIGQQ